MSNDDLVVCPSCNGQGQSFCFIEYADGHGSSGWMPCGTCQGVGKITLDHLWRIDCGRKLRDHRVHVLHRGPSEFAREIGIDVVELSQIEHGRIPLPNDIWDKYGMARPAGA